jgi:hypothetical protein
MIIMMTIQLRNAEHFYVVVITLSIHPLVTTTASIRFVLSVIFYKEQATQLFKIIHH